jgi:hypothetical protein
MKWVEESGSEHDGYSSTQLKTIVAPELGVFDSPLDPGGLGNLSEQLDSHPRLFSEEQSRAGSPVSEGPPSRAGHRMKSPQSALPMYQRRYSLRRMGNHSAPVYIPPSPDSDIDHDPMQRWQDSLPEDEPAALSAIINAIQTIPERNIEDPSSLGSSRQPADAFRGYRTIHSSISGESGDSKLS